MTFSSLSALQKIHGKDSNVFKGDEFYGLLDGGPEGGKSVQMTANNEAHAARRKVLNRALPARDQTFRTLNQLAQQFASAAATYACLSQSVEKGMGRWSARFDVSTVATWYSFDVIASVAFGESLNMLQDAEYRWVPGCLKSLSIWLYWAGYAGLFRFWRWFLGSPLPSVIGMQTVVDAQTYSHFASEMLANRARRLHDEKTITSQDSDIFKHLINANLYNERDLQSDSSLLIAAGSDANRLIISATIFYWVKNPDTLEKASKEIRSCVTSADQITDSTLSSLRYLRACVDETMRLSPPKASSLPREVMEGGITVDGIYVPKGMTVGTSTYALHHDSEIYPDPFSYNPDRWLQQPQDRRMSAAFCPFLKGPRMCPGQTVAYFAIELALFHLVYHYDLRAAAGESASSGLENITQDTKMNDEYHFKDWILGYADGPVIEIIEREL